EPEGVPDDVREILLHQQRLVLVDGEARPTLLSRERDVDPPLHHAVTKDECLEAIEQAESRILQVHTIDDPRGDRNRETIPGDDLLFGEAEDARHALPPARAVDAVEIDEQHGLAGPMAVGYAGAQSRADERQVRIAVARFDAALFLRQLLAQLQL